jgi:hypothetical protein
MIAGWDDEKGQLDVGKLCEILQPIIKLAYPQSKNSWCLLYIPFGKKEMHLYDRTGSYKERFSLNKSITGLAGAYTNYEHDTKVYLADILFRSDFLGVADKGSGGHIPDMIVGEDKRKKYQDALVKYNSSKRVYEYKMLPIFYLAPSSKGSWYDLSVNGGRGHFDPYLDNQTTWNKRAHERNVKVAKVYRSVYMGLLNKYIEELKKIPVKKGEDAIRKLGPPPEPYAFPLPAGSKEGSSERRDLADILVDCSSFRAWQEIGQKIYDMQESRWPEMESQHQEGNVYFRLKMTFEPDVLDKIKDFMKDAPVFGSVYSYKTIKLEYNFDVGTDGIKRGSARSITLKEGADMKIGKFSIGGGRDIEVDTKGGKKVTVKGNFMGYGCEVSTDGEQKLTGGWGTSASANLKTMEGGYGATVPIPGVGSIYLGIHFQSIKNETLLVFITRAPGFFERRSCEELVRTYWKNLTYPEKQKLNLLGWNQDLWDRKDQLKAREKPKSVNGPFEALSYDQRIAAMHLGFQKGYIDNWQKFWGKLPPVKE